LELYHAVFEATVQRARPILVTALAAVLAFIPLTTSVFWGSMACTLIGGTAAGTVLTLLFLLHSMPSGSGSRNRITQLRCNHWFYPGERHVLNQRFRVRNQNSGH
jgi:hypothetical protein